MLTGLLLCSGCSSSGVNPLASTSGSAASTNRGYDVDTAVAAPEKASYSHSDFTQDMILYNHTY